MNIKKYSLKTMCAALACTTVLSSMLAAYATDVIINETPMDDSAEINAINALADDSAGTDTGDSGWTTEENSYEDIKVTYQQSSSYAVTIPKTIALDSKKQAAYSVKVTGDIDANQRVYVAPVDGIADSENLDFYMKDLSGRKADVAAMVTHRKTYWSSANVTNSYEETQNCVSAPDLTAGTWEGTFQVEIRLETNVVQDEEETAPAEAYNDWNYTLDEENNIITLNYYIGLDYANPKKDVIVYANYVIDGKTYKTQIKSNDVNATVNTAYMFNNNFNYAQYIETIQFSGGIDMSNVTNMSYMFNSCTKLTSVDFGTDFNTKNVTNMAQMFNNCTSLTSLDVSDFDTSNVTNMSGMFSSCRALTDLDLSNFDTSKVTDMQSMFSKCVLLTSLDLGNFNTGNVMNMNYMFWDSSKLKTIYVTEGNWSSSQATTTWMFQNCGTSEVTYK